MKTLMNMKTLIMLVILTVAISQSHAAELNIALKIPEMTVAEYHAPYVAIWIEDDKHKAVADIAVWHEKNKWLKDLRTWWRRSGRYSSLPIDGVTGPTRRPGNYSIHWDTANLSEGHYHIVFESAREVGGREKLTLPFSLPIKKSATQTIYGKTEWGEITLTVTP